MLLLVTDTSGKQGGVGLVRVGDAAKAEDVVAIAEVALMGGTFSAQLVPQIAGLLEKHGFSKGDIGGFVVVSGPGSFTGLRVGLAAIKALAEVFEKPIVPVSLLEILASASGKLGRVLAALDAGRGEVYAGEYEVAEESADRVREHLLTKDEFLAAARHLGVVTPDATVAAVARESGVPVVLVDRPRAEMIGRVGWRRMQAGETVAPEQLEANYIRRTDAEIFAKPASIPGS